MNNQTVASPQSALATAVEPDKLIDLSRVPPWLKHAIARRNTWKDCVLEASCFGPIHDALPSVPFHHLAVRLDDEPMKMGWTIDGKRRTTDMPHDHVHVISAEASVNVWWDRPVNFACLYFTPEALQAAAGQDLVRSSVLEVRSDLAVQAPTLSHLVRALHSDTILNRPHGALLGESIFASIATLLANDGRLVNLVHQRKDVGDWRVRRALEFIHANIKENLDLQSIARAASTSPFYLNRSFKSVTGQSIWQYVSQERTRLAAEMMRSPSISLSQIATDAGFESYSSFAAAFKSQFDVSPAQFRKEHLAT
ncbi:helix-turn-helix domain-containing protein [Granulicella sibirica]|uniref:helix-turn-helix domain-containing protein n=1 Tax=Granulicella sibirica TaxID=2479048 RepID=UPI001008B25A|nr:AraC family transcriptional regulator [Granulicella sibirica]